MLTLTKIANELKNNGYEKISQEVYKLAFEEENRQNSLEKWASVLNKNKEKMLIQNDIYTFEKAIKLCSLSQLISHAHLKNTLIKMASNYFNNIKTASIFTWLGDLARGAWSQLWSPFQPIVNKGAFRRLHMSIQKEFIAKLNRYLALFLKTEENSPKYGELIKKLNQYLMEMLRTYQNEAASANRSDNGLNLALSVLMKRAIEVFFSYLRKEAPFVPTLRQLIASSWDILTGMSNRSQALQSDSQSQRPAQVQTQPERYNSGGTVPTEGKDSYYITRERYNQFKKSYPTIADSVLSQLGIPEDLNQWRKAGKVSDGKGGEIEVGKFDIPVAKLIEFINSRSDGEQILNKLVHTDLLGKQNWRNVGPKNTQQSGHGDFGTTTEDKGLRQQEKELSDASRL